jgi:probable HAF family extracellular repeat protein
MPALSMKTISDRKELLLGPLLCSLWNLPTALAQTYSISDIALNSWSYSEAHGINDLGSVVGEFEANNSSDVLAFQYRNGAITELGHLGGNPYAVPYGANNDAAVGESDTGNNTHAFLYQNGNMTDLGILGNNNNAGYSSAHAINRAGAIAGEASISFNQAGTIHAVLYDGNAKTDLGALGGDYSSANALNNSNVIVGESDIVQQGVTNVHAFVYTNAAIHDLGTLGGGYSSAKGVNDSGVIVGEAETVIGGVTYLRAFVFRNGGMTDLGTLGGTVSSASAINSSGQIVGYATDTNEVSNAFLYDGSRMLNLINFIPAGSAWTNLTSADAINDAGQIAGSGYLADGSFHAYLLTPAGSTPVTILSPGFGANGFSFSFATKSGLTYQAQFSSSLTNNWLVFTNVAGNGSTARVTDTTAPRTKRYYRVLAQ